MFEDSAGDVENVTWGQRRREDSGDLDLTNGARSEADIVFFASTEYPDDLELQDLFIVWVESESWTGNIAVTTKGVPQHLVGARLDPRWCKGSGRVRER